MIRERHRNEILIAQRTMRRFETIARNSRRKFYGILIEAHSEGATPTELAKLVGLSFQRIKQIVYEKEDET